MPDDINIAFKTTADSSGADQIAADVKQVTEEIEAQGKALVEVGEKADAVGPKLDTITNLQRAQLAEQLGRGFEQIAEKLKNLSAELAPVNRELSQTLANMAEGFGSASTAIQGAIAGFFVFGPAGAAVGATIGGVIVPALKDMTGELIATAKAEAFAAEQARKLREEWKSHKGDVFSEKALEQYQAEAAAIDELLEKTIRLNKLRGGKEAADAAERDAADAEEKRNGVDPEIVDKRRALDNAAAAKEKIARDIEDKKQVENARAEAMTKARAARDELAATRGARPELIDEASKRAKEAAAEWEKSNAARVLAEQLAPDAIRKIDAQTGAKVASLEEQQRQRIFAEDRKAEEAKRRAEEQWARDSLDSGRENLNTRARSAADDIFQRAAGGGRGPRDPNIIAASGVANALADGTTPKELEALARKVDANLPKASDAMVRLLHTVISGLQDQAAKVSAMEGQVKNLRAGK